MTNQRRIVFASAFILNMIAFYITLVLLSAGYMEGNKIMAFMLSSNVVYAFLFALSLWSLLFVILIYLPEKHGGIWLNSSFYGVVVLFLLILIDFTHDLLVWIGG